MEGSSGLVGDIRRAVASEQLDLGGYTEQRTHDLVVAAFGTPLTVPTEMIRFTFVVGGGKLVRARYAEQLPKWITAALRDVGFVEDRSAACTLDCQGTFKQQKDTGANLLTIQVFPRLALTASAAPTEAIDEKDIAVVDVESPEYLVISSDLDIFQRMIVPVKARSWLQKKRLLKALQGSMAAFTQLEEKLMRGETLQPVEQMMYDGNAGSDVNADKCAWLQSEIKRMADAGELTKAEKTELLGNLEQNLATLATELESASGKKKDKLMEKQAALEARRTAVEGFKADKVYRLKKSAEIIKLRVELLAVLALQEKERSLSLTSEDMRRLEGRRGLESSIAALEAQSEEWFDDQFDAKCAADAKDAAALYSKKAKAKTTTSMGKSSGSSGGNGWATVAKKKAPVKTTKSGGGKASGGFAAAFGNDSDSD
ncbi:Aste57867_22506 [Aphanomyces stellatus]|uniref:Aste57867_22506 protein n=1 Tax=Aphanomyces stellatus TaxID=120398 RepID=A0A485LK90_9STRA|nr:hypothetical protein As57867_022436 [Aphanomyces stellatus]VFT99166.1 Aste57867_22506 [Aphanomyces stellatus]